MGSRHFGWLVPKTRIGAVGRMFLAAVIFVGCGAATTAVAGLLEFKTLAGYIAVHPPIRSRRLVLPKAGKPQTLLLIGSDHRAGEGTKDAHTDTMLLVRLNAKSATINLMSIPRDLQVTIRGSTQKLNAAYEDGSYSELLDTIHDQVFPRLQVDHIVDTNFRGFSNIIDELGCVYGQVDHRYYNVSENNVVNNFSSIDIEPGYQRLCGANESVAGALAFVRFRHTDSDILREARQQDFIRWGKGQFSTGELWSKRKRLFKILGKYSNTDRNLHTGGGLLELASLLVHSNASSIKQIPFPASSTETDGVDYVVSTPSARAQAYSQFMRATTAQRPAKRGGRAAGAEQPRRPSRGSRLDTRGLERDPGDGIDQARALTNPGMPVYYPTYIVAPHVEGAVTWQPAYCRSQIGNCNSDIEPATAYEHSYPRQYRIPIKGERGTFARAYVMTVQLSAATDAYYSVEGVAWKDPPLLRDPSETRVVHGRRLSLYAAGGRLTTVAWHEGRNSYWIQNDLTSDIPNPEMVALAGSMRRFRGG